MSVLDETTRIAPIPAEDRPRTCPGRPATLRSPKILDQLAVVYIRHSDPQQVLKHREVAGPAVCPRRPCGHAGAGPGIAS